MVDKSILKKLILGAIERNDVHQLKQLYAQSPAVFGMAMKTHSFQTSFSYYVLGIAPETLGVLVQLGLDLNRHDNEGYAPGGTYPLDSCIHRRKFETARLLLQNGADPNLCNALNTVSYMGDEATSADQIAMAQLLIDYGADVNREFPTLPGFTPLLRALEKGHTELAGFLIFKGAVMPDLPEPQPELNLDTFQARLEKACIDYWDTMRNRFSNERFCLFGLATDSDFVILSPLLDSEGAVERDASNRRSGQSYVARVSLDCDSEFFGQGKEIFDEMCGELNSRYGASEGRWARSRRLKKLLGIFEESLKNLDAKGMFGTGPERERIILLISIIDADRGEWNTMLKVAKRLNPANVFNQFKASLRLR